MFTIVDLLLVVLVAGFIGYGLAQGFIRAIGSLIGFLLGFIVAGWVLVILHQFIDLQSHPFLAIILFFILSSLASGVFGWIVGLIDGLRKIARFIPFFSSINTFLGGVFGFAEGLLCIAAVAYFSQYLPEGGLKASILDSQIVHWLSWLTAILSKLIPTITF